MRSDSEEEEATPEFPESGEEQEEKDEEVIITNPPDQKTTACPISLPRQAGVKDALPEKVGDLFWFVTKGKEELETDQAADPSLIPILELCRQRSRDENSLTRAQHSAIRDFVIKDDVLFKTVFHLGQKYERLVVPVSWRRPLMELLHCGVLGGHLSHSK